MWRSIRYLVLACAIAISVTSHAAEEAATYPILLDRPSQKGYKAPLEMVYAQLVTTKTTWRGYEPTTIEESFGAHFLCDQEVQDVDENGNTTLATFTIRKCTRLKDKTEEEVLPPGTKVVARAKGAETEILIDDKPPTGPAAEVLSRLITLGRTKEVPTWDKICGSTTPRKVGENWPIDAKLVQAYMKAHGDKVDQKDISGEVAAKAMETYEGEPCLRVEADERVQHFSEAKPMQRSSMVLKDANSSSHTTWLAPLDLKKDVSSMTAESTFEYTWTGERSGITYEMVQTYQTEVDARIPKE